MPTERYRANTVGVIAQALKGYIGHEAVISELLQNADDAGADTIEFHFSERMLIVRNNSFFTDKDWSNIAEIASAGKRREEGKIGTFGTGFISVYHITDQPEILSSGRHKILKPIAGEIDVHDVDIGETTEFRFPWRFQSSELSERIESPVWDSTRIEEFISAARAFIPHACLFLRHVGQARIFVGTLLTDTFQRTRLGEDSVGGYQREIWQLEHQDKVQTWLYYHGQNSAPPPVSLAVKDRRVSIAFPIEEAIEGKLYNFLPTQIRTGHAFHVNGAFFPDNNRRGILDDTGTNADRTDWNHSLLNTAAEIFADVLLDIRDQFEKYQQTHENFYHVLPFGKATNGHNLAAIRGRFVERARSVDLVFSTLECWQRADKVFAANANLYDLAHSHLPLLPPEAKEIESFLRSELGTRTLTLRVLLKLIQSELRDGCLLAEAHPLLSTRERLEKLYRELPKPPHVDFKWLRLQPIFLSEQGTLEQAKNLWRAEKPIRNLFKRDDRPLFADETMQAAWHDGYLEDFRGAQIVDWLWNWEQQHGNEVYFDDEAHLKKILGAVRADIKNVASAKLSRLHIVRVNGSDEWFPSSFPNLFFASDSQFDLELDALWLVKPELAGNRDVRQVYEQAGIRRLEPSDVISVLNAGTIRPEIAFVRRIYHYLGQHQLQPKDVHILQQLPIYLTANGRWVTHTEQLDLSLKPRIQMRRWGEIKTVLDKLKLDNYIHPDLESETKFLGQIGIHPLNEESFNERLVEQYYLSSSLNHEDRLLLLEYLRSTLQEAGDERFKQMVRTAPVIACADGGYRRADEVYFPTALLDEVLGGEYPQPHPIYEIERATNTDDESEKTPYKRSVWYHFFHDLKMLEEPRPEDVIVRIKSTVSQPVSEAGVQSIEQIFRYLDHLTKDRLNPYVELAQLAWLPAEEDDVQWWKPDQIFEKRHKSLIGQQAPILRYYNDTRSALRTFLGLPERPRGDLVARHLLASSANNTSVTPRIYEYLGEHWDEVSRIHQQRIKKEPCIWDGNQKRFWQAAKCFLGSEESKFFGRHCFYLEHPKGHLAELYAQLRIGGSAENYHRIAFLRDLASASIAEDDLELLRANLEHIGKSPDQFKDVIDACRQIRIVPDDAGNLYRPETIVRNDRPNWRTKAEWIDVPFVHQTFNTEAIINFLDAVGVPRLSDATVRIVDAGNKRENLSLKQKLLDRVPYFRRVLYHRHGTTVLGYDFSSLTVFDCSPLVARYEVIGKSSSPVSEDAAFSREENALYCVRGVKEERLAPRLVDVLHLDLDPITVASILSKPLAEISSYLDDLEIRPLPDDPIADPHLPTDMPQLAHPGEPTDVVDQDEVDDFPDEQGEDSSPDEEIVEPTIDPLVGGVGDTHHPITDESEETEPEADMSDSGERPERSETGHAPPYVGRPRRPYSGASRRTGGGQAPHYPNDLSELLDQFGIDQEYPETVPAPPANDFDDEVFPDHIPDVMPASVPWNSTEAEAGTTHWAPYADWFDNLDAEEVFNSAHILHYELPDPEHRRGVFQTICRVFGEDGNVLYVSAIRDGVYARRPEVAEGSISAILSIARCFESLGEGYWRFDARYMEFSLDQLSAAAAYHRGVIWTYQQQIPNADITPNTAEELSSESIAVDLETYLLYLPSQYHERQHDMLRSAAQAAEAASLFDVALALFQILDQRGVRGFGAKIASLRQMDTVQRISSRVGDYTYLEQERWQIWVTAYQENPDSLVLRDVIRKDIREAARSINSDVNRHIRSSLIEVSQGYTAWLRSINPLYELWQSEELRLLEDGLPLVFEQLVRFKQYDLAVQLIASCPVDSRVLRDPKQVDMHKYLNAVSVVATELESEEHPLAGALLLEYGLFLAKRTKQTLVDIAEYQLEIEQARDLFLDIALVLRTKEYLARWVNMVLFEELLSTNHGM